MHLLSVTLLEWGSKRLFLLWTLFIVLVLSGTVISYTKLLSTFFCTKCFDGNLSWCEALFLIQKDLLMMFFASWEFPR